VTRAAAIALRATFAAAFAWGLGVAPALASSSSTAASITALLALGCGALGPWLALRRHAVGRHVGISAFLGLVVATWLLAPSSIGFEALDATRGIFGSIAFGAFALAWGGFEAAGENESDLLPHDMPARAARPWYAVPITLFGCAAGLGCCALAWSAPDRNRALFAHAAALTVAVTLMQASTTFASRRAAPMNTPSWRGLVAALAWGAMATLFGAIGWFVGR